jgi:phospholipid/cholesterol/gamma-HCH transport system substrate-binding protein
MRRDTVNYMMVGSFVVIMAIAFVVLLFAVTGRSGPTDTYFVYYENVSGLKFGTGVFYEGYRVGQIERIEPQTGAEGMRYRIELSVAAGWKIPVDSIANVQSSGLISAVSIQISEGESRETLAPGATLAGRGQTDMFAVLNQVATDFRELSQEGIVPVLHNVNQRVTGLAEEMIRFRRDDLSPFVKMMHERLDRDVISEAQQLLKHLDESALGLKAMVDGENQDKVRVFLTHLDDVAVNLNGLVGRIEDTRLQMNGVLSALGGVVTDNQNEIKQAVGAADISMAELQAAIQTVNQHLGTIMLNVDGSARNMNEFTRAIRDNPARIIRSSSGEEPGSR